MIVFHLEGKWYNQEGQNMVTFCLFLQFINACISSLAALRDGNKHFYNFVEFKLTWLYKLQYADCVINLWSTCQDQFCPSYISTQHNLCQYIQHTGNTNWQVLRLQTLFNNTFTWSYLTKSNYAKMAIKTFSQKHQRVIVSYLP